MTTCRIGIVGGGPGGLLTAWRLQQYLRVPCDITLLEASDRLGGKLQTLRFTHSPIPYEAGAAEFYDYSVTGEDPLKDLVLSLGLSISPMGGSAVLLDGQVLAHLDDIEAHCGSAVRVELEEFDRRSVDALGRHEFFEADLLQNQSLAQFPGSFARRLDQLQHPQARRFLETLIHSDLATEPGHTSVPYGLHNYLMNRPEYLRLYSIVGGNERLIEELVRRLDVRFRMQHRVSTIEAHPTGHYTVTATIPGPAGQTSASSFEFDYVVVALPNPLLRQLQFVGHGVADAVHRHQSHHAHPAHYLRMTLLFDRPFWRSVLPESYCMLDQFGGCCLYDESIRNPAADEGLLGWLLGGDAALELSERSDAELIQLALDSLPPALKFGASLFREGRVHRWISEVSALPGGWEVWSTDRRHQPAPQSAPGLFLVGDYLFDSTLNGVLDSADHVAGWIASLLESSCPSSRRPAITLQPQQEALS